MSDERWTMRSTLWCFYYQSRMRLAHKMGFCYPEPSLVADGAVWCHWCGMRGKVPLSGAAMEAAMVQKLRDENPKEWPKLEADPRSKGKTRP